MLINQLKGTSKKKLLLLLRLLLFGCSFPVVVVVGDVTVPTNTEVTLVFL